MTISNTGPRTLTRAAELATVVGLLVATAIGVGAWLHPSSPAGHLVAPAPASPVAEAAASPVPETAPAAATPTRPPPTANTLYLDAMAPSEGAANLGRLPAALQGRAGYEHPVSLPCATGQSGDKHRQVTYPVRKRYTGLRASIAPYRDPADDVDFQVTVFGDDRVLGSWTVTAGTVATLDVALADVGNLAIRLTCGLPGGTLVLAAPALRR